MSDFGSLRIALSSLYAAQKGLEITGHNIANAKSEGYSRQRVITTADGGPAIAAMFSRWQAGGYGVKSVFVSRVNDVFLTNRTYIEHGANGAAQESNRIFEQLESVFPEPSENGIQQQLSDFWSSWDDIANQPGDLGARSQLLAQTNVLLDKLHQSAADIHAIRDDATARLAAAIDEVNNLTSRIATLNSTIVASTTSGASPSDLLDQRDLLVRKLSDLVDITVRYDADGQLDIFVPGGPILLGGTQSELELQVNPDGVAVNFASGAGSDLSFGGGSVAAFIDSVNETIPTFLSALDIVANNLRDTVNAGLGVYSGGLALADQDQSAAGNLQFDLSYNGAAPVTISVPGADWSGLGGAAALESAILGAINADPAVAGKFSVVVTGGNGEPLNVTLATVSPADRYETSEVAGNIGYDRLFGAASLTGTLAAADQNLSAHATLEFQVRLNGGSWSTISIPGADFSGVGGAAALETAIQNALTTAGVAATVRVSGGNGSEMHLAISEDDADDVLEIGAVFSGGSEVAGLRQLFGNVGVDQSRVGGLPFFTGSGALGLALNADLVADPTRLAVGRPGAGANDGAFALDLAEAGSRATGPDARYRALLGTLGAAAQRAQRIADNQDFMTAQVDASKDAMSGVNLDEEMIAMVQYQHAYAASARFLSAIDEMLDTLMNRVGR